ncbi:oxysterol-binding protein-related protein 8 [Arctopsyche grandis]|uniref:oxysterol-binding protein-related protein 8 n=1 Tax=Arctopsyche grandis TaxID=121162 RepID=UPI00406D7414
MSHSPAFENCSPAATTPSTPILRSLGGERNPSRSPPHTRDDKFSVYQLGPKEHHLATAAIGMTPEFILQSKDEIKHHKTSEKAHRSHVNLQVTLPSSVSNFPISGSNYTTDAQWHNLQHTPVNAPHSPGALSWTGDTVEATPSDRSSDTGPGSFGTAPRLSRKESYKAQRQNYRREKKRVTSELLLSLEDPAVIILADWLKVRGSLKSWTKLWCVLKPGLLLLYKSPKTKSNHWVGTVLLTACHVIERPSKKDGFCFKLYHPLEQSIWATRGPHNETIGAVVQPLPTAHLIFRAPSQTAGKCWLDGLELALKSSNMLLRCGGNSTVRTADTTTNHETQWSSEDLEKHFPEHDLEGAEISDTDSEGGHDLADRTDINILNDEDIMADKLLNHLTMLYNNELNDDVGQSGEVVEELAEENKSLLWYLVKQVRPGMDLSKVVLPTFILEPRSFLDKLSDSFYHSDILSSACQYTDPYDRIKTVVRWYLSGLYRKPRGLKKPYNPVLGETFRCCWLHNDSDTRTYYIAEQVSHHPPISAFYVSNRKEGFAIEASILAKSKFYGNSTSAILDGAARITLLPLRETYVATSPYAHCKGLLMGTLSMELGGRVTINCPSTSYSADIEFRLKPFIGGADSINMVSGRIRYHKETVATLEGHWDDKIDIKDRRTQEESILINVSELKTKRLQRQLINQNQLGEFESQRLWSKVSIAIANEDQVAATEEKTIIEEAQRERARGLGGKEWVPRYFRRSNSDDGNPVSSMQVSESTTNNWQYNYPNFTSWDDRIDVLEYEDNFVLKTLRRKILTSAVKVGSIRTLPQLETEHSASESDSTNSHHHRMSQGRQSVASALMRVQAELAGVMTMVGRLDDEQDSPLRAVKLRAHTVGEETNDASVLMAVLIQQQAVAGALARVEAALRERPIQPPPARALKSYISDHLFLILLLPLNIVAYFIFKWLFLE